MCGIAGFLAKRDGVDVAATLTAIQKRYVTKKRTMILA